VILSQRLLIVVFLLSLLSCGHKQEKKTEKINGQKVLAEKLIEANKQSVAVENEQIEKLLATSTWKMTETATGLRYELLEKGHGHKITTGNIVRFEYAVKLLTGENIYSSDKDGPKEIKVGSGGIESGLEEGLLYLRGGDKARFVIPSYLAYGLTGDQNKIPPKSTLIYNVKITDIKTDK